MLYQKNVPGVERWARILMGVVVAACGLYFLKLTLPGLLAAATGAFIAVTGFVGFCPMCYLGGRRLRQKA